MMYIIASTLSILSYVSTVMAMRYPLSIILWITSVICVLVPMGINAYMGLHKSRFCFNVSIHTLVAIMIIIISFCLGMYQIQKLPWNLDGDFASVGLQARAFLRTNHSLLTDFGWANIPMIGYLPVIVSMFIWGDNLVGLGMGSVIESSMTLVIVYLLGKEIHSPRVGLYAMAITAFSYVFIHFGRTAMYFDPVLFISVSVYCVLKSIKSKNIAYMILGGISAGFCVFLYFSGRAVFVIVPLIFAFTLLSNHRSTFVKLCKLYMWWVWGAIIAIGPFFLIFLSHYNAFVTRTQEVFLFNPDVMRHLQIMYQTNDDAVVIWEQIRRSLLMFHSTVDQSTQFGMRQPFLDPLTGMFFLVGLCTVFVKRKDIRYMSLSLWIGAVLITGSILTVNPPFWPRLVSLIVPACLLAALGVDTCIRVLSSFHIQKKYQRLAIFLFTITSFLYITSYNWISYIESTATYATPRTSVGRFLASLRKESFMIKNIEFSCLDREIQFLAEKYCVRDIPGEDNASFTPGKYYIIPRINNLVPNEVIEQILLSTHHIEDIVDEYGTVLFIVVKK